MTNINCGSLQFLKHDNVTSVFNLRLNQSYTVGTQTGCNIRLKVQTPVPEYSLLKTNDEGNTTFLSNGLRNCEINNKPFEGSRYLIPDDIINLFGKIFKYHNPSMTAETINMLQKENRKLFCNNMLKAKVVNKRHTMGKNSVIASISRKGSKTPAPKRSVFQSNFEVEDIKDHTVTPSHYSETSHAQRLKSLSNTLQYSRTSDNNRFSSRRELQTYLQCETSTNSSSEWDQTSLDDEVKRYSENQPRAPIPITALPFPLEIANSMEDITMLNDISAPFSEEFLMLNEKLNDTKFPNGEDSFVFIENKMVNNTGLAKGTPRAPSDRNANVSVNRMSTGIEKNVTRTPKSILKKPLENRNADMNKTQQNTSTEIVADVEKSPLLNQKISVLIEKDNAIEESLRARTPKSTRKAKSSNVIAETPTNRVRSSNLIEESQAKTPKSARKPTNDANIIEETPVNTRITRSSTRMTPNPRTPRLGTITDKRISKTPKMEKTILRDSTNVILESPTHQRKSTFEKNPYVHLIRDVLISSPGRYPGKVIKTNNKVITRRHSTFVRRSPETEKYISSNPSPTSPPSNQELSFHNFAILTNDSFVTRRHCRRIDTEKNDVFSIEGDGDDTDTGSSLSHYDDDTEAEMSEFVNVSGIENLDASANKSLQETKDHYGPSTIEEIQENILDEQTDNYTWDDSPSPNMGYANKSLEAPASKTPGIKRSRSLNNSVGRICKKRRMSAKEVLDIERITELLEIPQVTSRSSVNTLTDHEEITDLLHVSPQNESLQHSDIAEAMETIKNRQSRKSARTPKNYFNHTAGIRESLRTPKEQNSPKHDFSYMEEIATPKLIITPRKSLSCRRDVRKTLPTPKTPKENEIFPGDVAVVLLTRSTHEESPKDYLRAKKMLASPKSQTLPIGDLSNVEHDKHETPKVQNGSNDDLSNVQEVKKLTPILKRQKSPKNDLTNVHGLKKLMATPKFPKSPKNDLSNIISVSKLFATQKVQNPPKNDLTHIHGVKKLMATPKFPKSPKNDLSNVGGVSKLFATQKVQNPPKNDLTHIHGVKKLMATPKLQKSPENDLRNVGGVSKLFATRKVQNSPKDDLTDIHGVKKLLASPKLQKSPKNDLSEVGGVKELFIPHKVKSSPKNDLTAVAGIRKFTSTRNAQKSLQNNSPEIREVQEFGALETIASKEESKELSKFPDADSNASENVDDRRDAFDKLANRKSYRTYKSKSASPQDKNLNTSIRDKSILAWIDEQNKHASSSQSEAEAAQSAVDRIDEQEGTNKVKRPIRQTRRNKIEEKDIGADEDKVVSTRVATRSTRRNLENVNFKGQSTPENVNKNEYAKEFSNPQSGRGRYAKRDKKVNDIIESKVKSKPNRGSKKKEITKQSDAEVEEIYSDEQSIVSPPIRRTRRAAKEAAIKIDTTSTPKRGRPRRKPVQIKDISLNEEIKASARKKRLYNPDSYSEIPHMDSSEENVIDKKQEAQQTMGNKKTRSNRNVNLPKMLEMFEVSLNRKSVSKIVEAKQTAKRGQNKRKVEAENNFDVVQEATVRRSKRTRK